MYMLTMVMAFSLIAITATTVTGNDTAVYGTSIEEVQPSFYCEVCDMPPWDCYGCCLICFQLPWNCFGCCHICYQLPWNCICVCCDYFPDCDCTIASGIFQDGGGTNGAQWRLYRNGALVIDRGFVNTHVWAPWSFDINLDITSVLITGPITAGESLSSLFARLENVTVIEGLNNFDTSNVTNMSRMFQWGNMTSLDLSSFDTSNVTNMNSMFSFTNNLTTLDLSNFDTSNVSNMNSMFRGARALTRIDLSSFDTSNVANMSRMFGSMGNLTSLDLSNFDTGNVTSMSGMFDGSSSLKQLTLGEQFHFVEPIEWWEVDARIPDPPTNIYFTGYWQNVGTGTSEKPQGGYVFTATQLMEYFDSSTMADTWVWQPSFGTVPPTGIPNVTGLMAAMFALLAVSSVLWVFVLRGKYAVAKPSIAIPK